MSANMKPANAVVLHDCGRIFFTDQMEDADDICGDFGISPYICLDDKTLLAILDALGIEHRSYSRSAFNQKKGQMVTYRRQLGDDGLPLFKKEYAYTDCIKIEVAENENGFIRIQATRSCVGLNGEPDSYVENISHFGAYSIVWSS